MSKQNKPVETKPAVEITPLQFGEVIEDGGFKYEVHQHEFRLRHKSHGKREDGKSGYESKPYSIRLLWPADIQSAVNLLGESELLELARTKYGYTAKAKIEAELSGRLDENLSVDPMELSIVDCRSFDPSTRSKLTKDEKANLDLFNAKLKKSGKDIATLPPMGGVVLSAESSDKMKAKWLAAYLVESDF